MSMTLHCDPTLQLAIVILSQQAWQHMTSTHPMTMHVGNFLSHCTIGIVPGDGGRCGIDDGKQRPLGWVRRKPEATPAPEIVGISWKAKMVWTGSVRSLHIGSAMFELEIRHFPGPKSESLHSPFKVDSLHVPAVDPFQAQVAKVPRPTQHLWWQWSLQSVSRPETTVTDGTDLSCRR